MMSSDKFSHEAFESPFSGEEKKENAREMVNARKCVHVEKR